MTSISQNINIGLMVLEVNVRVFAKHYFSEAIKGTLLVVVTHVPLFDSKLKMADRF